MGDSVYLIAASDLWVFELFLSILIDMCLNVIQMAPLQSLVALGEDC